ncbi:hydroxymethylglutaryl-CoA synthase family protein [Candidatus Nitrosocosmicus hydrocola]|uniref:hydroxymethylglutaryl-CoA synthase family protein n=1 Tax=Candidatus Nitrosocosmicus hydrocola TaxID=1826872 RepID=UPI000ABCF859|nr:hydroxymethylglutaryl-CoA synthase [Candidatus Nitrosocosmicus hydrocola]
MPVGIDDMAIYVPKLYVDYKDFAEARGIDPQKLEYGIGIKKMALADANQDPASMAANACMRLMKNNDLHPQDIGRIYVATESGLDESKAMNSFVIGMLEQVYGDSTLEHAGGIECKFACVSGSYALYDNTNWIRAGESNDKAAIVIVSDIAKYDIGSAGEYTQGAGAIALLIKENPRLLAFDERVTSTIIKNEYDFYRPFGKETPLVNGLYSNLLYLIQVRKALETYKEKALKTGIVVLKEDESITDHIDYISVHLPYRRMGEKALAYLLRHEWRHLPRWQKITEEIGLDEPIPKDPRGTIESILADVEFMKADEKFRREFMKTEHYRNVFDRKMSSSLQASALIGNLYTASMYMGLRSLLEFEYVKNVDLYGKRIGFGSYGSGCSAMVFSGVIQENYKELVSRMNLDKDIGPRTKMSIEDYEKLHKNTRKYDQAFLNAEDEFILVNIGGNTADRAGFREYCYAS